MNATLLAYQTDAAQILRRTWDLADHLMFKYANRKIHYILPVDGPTGTSTSPRKFDVNGVTTENAEVMDQPGYPEKWLAAVGFGDGPSPPPDCEDLGWRCGHRAGAGVSMNRLRVSSGGDGSVDEGKGLAGDWIDYSSRKADAVEKGITGCFSRGDIGAAVGGSSCKGKASMYGVGGGNSVDENGQFFVTSE